MLVSVHKVFAKDKFRLDREQSLMGFYLKEKACRDITEYVNAHNSHGESEFCSQAHQTPTIQIYT